MTTAIRTAVQGIINRGLDPRLYRRGLAETRGWALEEIEAVIAELAPPVCTDGSGVADRQQYRSHGEGAGRREIERQMAAEDRADREA